MIEKIEKTLIKSLATAAKAVGIVAPKVSLEHPDIISHGDYSTNLALAYAKESKVNPKILAEKIVEEFKKKMPDFIAKIETAGPGFIDIKLKDEIFAKEILDIGKDYGKGIHDKGKKIMVEYTDPNPFKIFHIGHLMANTVGEALSRIVEFSGGNVVRANYYGDVGLHVAKTLWGVLQNKEKFPTESIQLLSRIEFLGDMYTLGSKKYETDETAKKEIIEINKKIFEKTDKEINSYYDLGKKWSLEYFETIYKKLGTHFDYYFPESEVAEEGVKVVEEFLKKGVFEKSEGAIIFPGEKHGLHTRVFITSQGLPTYETKEIGLTKKKFEVEPKLAESIVVTANEQDDYFKVVLKALSLMYPDLAKKTTHKSHGLLRFSSGKMSSRKGNIISAEDLIQEIEVMVEEKIKDRKFTSEEYTGIRADVSTAALKYAILRQAIGGDIIYDKEKSVSFEGDSGPYLQYACVRAGTVLIKAEEAVISKKVSVMPEEVTLLEKLLARFPKIVERSRLEYSPHYITTYLTELAAAFNSYYANNLIIDQKNPLSPYRVALTKAFVHVMKNGLWLLGIKVPKRM